MIKKRKITQAFENNPEMLKGERCFIRVKGKLYDVTRTNTLYTVESDIQKIKEIMQHEGVNSYTMIHQHLYSKDSSNMGSIPSPGDFLDFLRYDDIKTMMIAQQALELRNKESGKVGGYWVFRKTRKTNKTNFRESDYTNDNERERAIVREEKANPYFRGITRDINYYTKVLLNGISWIGEKGILNLEERKKALKLITKKYHLKAKFISEPGYVFREGTDFIEGGLETKVSATTAIIGFLSSFFFLSSNFTGNAISNLTLKTLNIIGATLFIIGLIGAFFYFKKRKAKVL